MMLDQIVQDGVRMCTLTWNGANALGSGNLTSEGLTGFGRSMVRELEAREIIVDVSHLNDEGFKDVCKVVEKSRSPLPTRMRDRYALIRAISRIGSCARSPIAVASWA